MVAAFETELPMSHSTYPHDPRDPALRSCKRCGERYMPPAFCDTHDRTCLTCCNRLGLACGIRTAGAAVESLAKPALKVALSMERAARAIDSLAAQVQRDIEDLYGPEEDR